MKNLKLYLETSTWNFYFADDAPQEKDVTKLFFSSLKENDYEIFISEVVIREIQDAPEPKRDQLLKLIKQYAPVELEVTEEVNELTENYMAHSIVPKGKRDDAFHIAVASVYEIDAVISWNYQHLVNLRKSELFNGVNLEKGYTKRLEIVTPREVIKYEGK